MKQKGEEYNKGGLIAFVFSMVFSILFIFYLIFLHPGVNLHQVKDVEPAAQVAAGTEAAKPAELPKELWKDSEVMVAKGKQVFQTTCTPCHGAEGKGDGPAAATLQPPPRNLVEGKWKQGGTSIALFKTIAGGIPGSGMVGFSQLPIADRWGLVQFIRSITKNKEQDKPAELEKFAAEAK